jgi:hypothetical protein
MYHTKRSYRKKIESERLQSTAKKLESLGFEIWDITDKKIQFYYKESLVTFYPFTGWHTGKSIKDGRGFNNLLKQIT